MASFAERLGVLEAFFARFTPRVAYYPSEAINSLPWDDQVAMSLALYRLGPGPYWRVDDLAALSDEELADLERIVSTLEGLA